ARVAFHLQGLYLVVEGIVEIGLERHGRRAYGNRISDRQVRFPLRRKPSRVPSLHQLDGGAAVVLTEVPLLVERRPGLHVGAEPREEAEGGRVARIEPGAARPVEKEAAIRVVPESWKIEVGVGARSG